MNNSFIGDVDLSQLVLIDLQTRLLAAMPNISALLKMNRLLLAIAQCLKLPTLLTEQYPQGLGSTTASVLALAPKPPIAKTSFSCYGSSAFRQALLPERNQVVLAGIETHICVLQTALDLSNAGWQVFVVADAVASIQSAHHHNALAQLAMAGCRVTSVEAMAFEWLKNSEHAQFKQVSQLIKHS